MVRTALLVSLILTLLSGVPCASEAQVFRDDFDGPGIDTSKWVVDPGDGAIVVSGGFAWLTGPPGRFPVITTRDNPFPADGDFVVKIGFRYPEVHCCGNGFGASNGTAGEPGFRVWQDCAKWYVGIGNQGMNLKEGGTLHFDGPTDLHVYEWDYVGGTYCFSIDGKVGGSDFLGIACGGSTSRPTGIFFGNPDASCLPGGDGWTLQQIDFVDVERVGATSVRPATFGSVKTRYH